MSFKKNIRNKKGSYIVEAALTLPLFIICVAALALIIDIAAICENIGFLTAAEVRDMDVDAYKEKSLEKAGLAAAAEEFFIEETILKENPRLTDFEIRNLDYLYSDGNIDDLIGIDTVSVFTVDNPLGIFGRIEFSQGLLTRGFTGSLQESSPLSESEFKDNQASKVVWIFPKYGIRYHRPDCRYVKQDYEGEEYKLEMQQEDAGRKGYTPCLVCGGGTNE
ncbi:MAG: hypothetical protein IJB73_07800 [Firmicutes bacterium]|nr:hypothetical protein [Bacillota bacterium]